MSDAIQVEALRKRFGEVVALDGLDLLAPEGDVLALLGPNGAGKTTLVRALATLLVPDSGRALVLGRDVVADPFGVRSEIGLAGQFAAVDEILTGRENLEMVGMLYHLGRREAGRRATEVLERFGLADAADRRASTYSGGMRRRLDLAATLVGRPRVLFLDEPSTGLDPRSRAQLWEMVRELRAEGTTILLTTQYLEEADQLAHLIAVIVQGRIVAEGTAHELKERVGRDRLIVRISDADKLEDATRSLSGLTGSGRGEVLGDAELSLPIAGPDVSADAVRALDRVGVGIASLEIRSPTLDDVFFSLTGRHVEAQTAPDNQLEEVAA
ncbi:MAG TPA: ATP-binding cassette domain-containing protein [Solirubrobacteraceae bacterium]|nr:ATP-binding cassette domain-containing protein [Solirubrobacteraceae bacterium]